MLKQACQLMAIAALLLVVVAGRWSWHESDMVAAKTLQVQKEHDGQHDFDFYVGKWRQHNRRLINKQWIEFESTAVARRMWDGRAGMDEFEAETPSGHLEGMTVRLYNADTHDWSIYSSSGAGSAFSSPASIGRFENGRGAFYEHKELDGSPVYVRFLWEVRSQKQYHWEQAFSTDQGKTWETNWIIDSMKMEGPTL